MPSPIGHALAGIATAWGADLVAGNRADRIASREAPSWRAGGGLTLACAILAVAPDLDLFISRFHRSATHSVTSVVVIGMIAALVAARSGRPVARVAGTCAAAWATHLLLDWLAVDRVYYPFGIQLWWPFGSRWFISGWNLFAGTERHDILGATAIRENAAAIVQEIAILGPVVLAVWLARARALAGRSAGLTRRHHDAEGR